MFSEQVIKNMVQKMCIHSRLFFKATMQVQQTMGIFRFEIEVNKILFHY